MPRRFGLPQPPPTFSNIQSATAFGAACPQQPFQLSLPSDTMTPSKRQSSLKESEDCLFINVLRPTGTRANAGLPILFWIFGGGFEIGDTSLNDGTTLVSRSIQLNEPIIYISANYRLNGKSHDLPPL
ncbi:hypothetical protein Clacol_004228 [Clathrus columnatus]|uniref:Carboxylesterase type B domain-containing protein n=1 Tax=Clathrus columnatus TaxID=1419009 RepID=A0AAV5A8Z2_9AGAM|nr:hypothetical protein Clacol_004228 [Clathrus columnatus]